MKRAIDRYLLAPLAATLVEHRFPEGDQFLFVRSDGRGIQVEFVDPDAPEGALEIPAARLASRRTLPRMMLQAAGTGDERAALAAELIRLEALATGDAWRMAEEAIATAMHQPEFWGRPERFRILARYALMDRVRAAIDTARGLEERLQRSAQHGGGSRELVTRLACHLYIIEHGIEDVTSDAPVEVVLAVQPVLDASDDPTAGSQWSERLLGMYRRWASRRQMQAQEMTGGTPPSGFAVISGFGAHRILSPEAGLHILEADGPNIRRARSVARVRLAPTPDDLPERTGEREAVLSAVLDRAPAADGVVRRYRLDAAPLIRDVRRGWRTGRVEWVMDGQFDLLPPVRQSD